MTTTIESVEGLAELIASRPELAQFTDDQWALAQALASVFQQPDPTAEQCSYFIDDAEACADSVGPGPYKVVKLGEATGNFNAVVRINGWLCAAEEGEGFIEVTPMSDLRGWTIAEYEPCHSAREWGECVLANGHETWESGYVSDRPATHHVDRNGRAWGVSATGGGN